MAISFPNNPTTNQTFTVGVKTWIWNGYAWDLVLANTAPIYDFAGQAFNTANSASANTIHTQGVDVAQNTRIYTVEANTIYLFGALNQTNTDIISANTQLKSYTDGLVSSSNTQLKNYTDGSISSANTQLKSYTDGLFSYNSGINATQNTNITGATTLAQAAYNQANTVSNYLPLSGGTLTGRVHQSVSGFGAVSITDITSRTNSGFYQTSSANTILGWPQTTLSWYHLLSSTHTNDANYYSMQFAGNFYDSANVYYRVTNGSGSTSWNKIWHSGNDGLGSGLDADLLDGQSGSYYSPLTFTQSAYNQANTDYTTVVAVAGDYGNSTITPVFKLAANGRITSVTNTSIAFPVTSVGGLGVTGAVSNTQLSTSVIAGLGYTPVQAGTSTIGQAPTYANMQGGRTYTTYDMSTFANLYETRFVNLGSSTNVPAGMSGLGYWFGMGAGDVGARGFDLVGTSGSGLWYRERSSNTWNNILTINGTGTNLTALNASNLTSGTVSTARLGTGTANANTYLAGDNTWKTISNGTTAVAIRQSFTATSGQTSFTISGGYTPYIIDVYRNGIKLLNGTDVIVSSGTVVVLTVGASTGDTIDVVGYTSVYSLVGTISAGNLTGTIPSSVLVNSTLYIGTTAITLNRSSASQSLTGVNIDGSANSANTFTSTTQNSQFNSIGVGTAASGTAGEIRATNAVTAFYSDKRLKKDIRVIPDAIEKLNKISGVTFVPNHIAEKYGYTDKKEQVGVIAQDVESVLPQVVVPAPFDIGKNDDGTEYSISGENYKTVHYEKLIPLLIQSIKEQQTQIESLKCEIDTLKERLK